MINQLTDDKFHSLIEAIMQHPHSEELQVLFAEQLDDDTYAVVY
jgi:hypothetical protein